jgi:protein-S-isoprenylcysteine O-methyltransferase Ste14
MPLATALELSFVAWHVLLGFAGTSLLYRVRFGRSPNLVLGRGARWGRSRHRDVQLAMGIVSSVWALAVVAPAASSVLASTPLLRPVVEAPAALGWIVAGIGHVGMVASQLAMGRAFRVGLETSGPQAPAELVTWGPFRWSRHPVYAFSIVFLIGEWTWNANVLCAVSVVALAAGFDRLASEEDRHLRERFGDAHAEWSARVGRPFRAW